MIKLFLFDIEGTTTDINFVHKVLFPYSYSKMEMFISEHLNHPLVSTSIEQVKQTVKDEQGVELDLDGVIVQLKEWIQTDRKHPALKNIQGLIWDIGYSQAEFKGHLYPDVKPFFKRILKAGAQIGIYSSGSVHAQKLIFGFSTFGDLTPMISYFFDTQVGAKREKNSYLKITELTGYKPQEIHFFSDIPQELEAAQSIGMEVTQLLREGTAPTNINGVLTFDSILF